METLVVVDENDQVIGYESREKCHEGSGIRHRAFVVFIFNSKNELLIAKRSKFKKLWPNYWDLSCASHVYPDEDYKSAAERRLPQELGFKCNLKYLFKFVYQAPYKDVGSENEVCAVLIGKYDGEVKPNPKEVAEWKFMNLKELEEEITNEDRYTPWFRIAFEKLKKYNLENLLETLP